VPGLPRGSPLRRAYPHRVLRVRVAVVGWAVVLVTAVAWGRALLPTGRLWLGNVPPLVGHSRLLVWPLLPALALACALIVVAPAAAARLPWRLLLSTASIASAAWAVTIAASEGVARLAAPLAGDQDYLVDVPAVGADPLAWLRGFVEALPTYATHTKGHPPLPVLVFWMLDRVGLRGPGWAAALVIVAGASATAAAAIAARAIVDEALARRALPFLVLAPAAVWIATSADALFLGVSAWALAALVMAVSSGRAAPAIAAGLLLGVALYLSYGLALLAFPAAAIAVRTPRVLLVAASGVALVVAAASTAGFWWPAGVAATQAAWAAGVGDERPQGYFLLANLAVLGVLGGPAAVAGIARLTDRRLADRRLVPVVAATLVAIVIADLSGVMRGEVERIWLPYTPWLLIAGATLPSPRPWLAAQAATALTVQGLVRSPW
jgi:methylthioxylose transferase